MVNSCFLGFDQASRDLRQWSKGHFYYGKFVDSILQARMAAMMSGIVGKDGANAIDEDDVRNDIILRDRISQSHAILSMRMYAAALRMDSKHVYQALPRLLSLWFDLVSVSRESSTAVQSSKQDPISTYTSAISLLSMWLNTTNTKHRMQASCANIKTKPTHSWLGNLRKYPQ